MGVPDNTYFGKDLNGEPILYGQVRKVADNQERLSLLKNRIEAIFIDQTRQIASRDENGSPRIWSPFPLCILTLLGIETLGRIISDVEKIKGESKNKLTKKIVTPVYQLMDKNLLSKPTKKFYEGFEKIHGTKDKKSINRYSDIIHKYQRNTFNHGYQAKGVYLDHEISSFWILKEEQGFMVINPYLFWDRFEEIFERVFYEILDSTKQEWRKNALVYFDKLVN